MLTPLPEGTKVVHRNHHFHHEQNMGHTDMMKLAHEILERFLNGSPENGDRAALEEWLLAQHGMEAEFFDNHEGDVLLLQLTQWSITRASRLQDFVIRFAGYDAAEISIWCPVAEANF